MSNEQVPAAGDRDIIKPMDKHMPIGAPRVPTKKTAKGVPAERNTSGATSTTDNSAPVNPAPIAEPK